MNKVKYLILATIVTSVMGFSLFSKPLIKQFADGSVSPTPTPTCIPVPPCVYARPFHCEIAINQGYCPIPTPTPTSIPTPTPTSIPTPTPTPVISVTPTPTCIPVPPCVYARPFHCEIAINQGYCPIPTPTPTVPVTPVPTIPTAECPNGYVLQIVNSIMFCMEQSQSQSQSQSTTINNVNNNNNSSNNSSNNNNSNSSNSNPDINIGLSSYSGNNPAAIVYPSSNSTSLPNTGTPWQDLATIGFAPIGYVVKKITEKLS